MYKAIDSYAKKKYVIVPLLGKSYIGGHYQEKECVIKCILMKQIFSSSKYVKFDEARASKPNIIIYCQINNDKAVSSKCTIDYMVMYYKYKINIMCIGNVARMRYVQTKSSEHMDYTRHDAKNQYHYTPEDAMRHEATKSVSLTPKDAFE